MPKSRIGYPYVCGESSILAHPHAPTAGSEMISTSPNPCIRTNSFTYPHASICLPLESPPAFQEFRTTTFHSKCWNRVSEYLNKFRFAVTPDCFKQTSLELQLQSHPSVQMSAQFDFTPVRHSRSLVTNFCPTFVSSVDIKCHIHTDPSSCAVPFTP